MHHLLEKSAILLPLEHDHTACFKMCVYVKVIVLLTLFLRPTVSGCLITYAGQNVRPTYFNKTFAFTDVVGLVGGNENIECKCCIDEIECLKNMI